jgi:hypothetical protein
VCCASCAACCGPAASSCSPSRAGASSTRSRCACSFRHPAGAERSPEAYLALLRETGFAVASRDVSTPSPLWSRPDFGLRERLGFRPDSEREATELHVVARRLD